MQRNKSKQSLRPPSRATPETTETSLRQDKKGSAALRPTITSVIPYQSYVDQAVGINFGEYPKLMDDCLGRSIVTMQVLTGTGNKTISLDAEPSVIHPAITGVDPGKVTGAYQVEATLDVAKDGSLNLLIAAAAGITWSVLLLTQKAKQ